MKHISESLAKVISRWPKEKIERFKREMEKTKHIASHGAATEENNSEQI